jgi:hypothetical protein
MQDESKKLFDSMHHIDYAHLKRDTPIIRVLPDLASGTPDISSRTSDVTSSIAPRRFNPMRSMTHNVGRKETTIQLNPPKHFVNGHRIIRTKSDFYVILKQL